MKKRGIGREREGEEREKYDDDEKGVTMEDDARARERLSGEKKQTVVYMVILLNVLRDDVRSVRDQPGYAMMLGGRG